MGEGSNSEKQGFLRYRDSVEYKIVDGDNNNIESGRASADTHPVEIEPGESEWNTQFHLYPDGALQTTGDNSPRHAAYENGGCVVRLWDLRDDTQGNYAKHVHEELVGLLKMGLPASEVEQRLNDIISEIEGKMEKGNPVKQLKG